MRLHVEALFTRDRSGRLLAVNEPGGGPAPRFFLGRTSEGNECWVRHDLHAELTHDLISLAEAAPPSLETDASPESAAPFLKRLEETEPVTKTWMGPAYHFPPNLPAFDNVIRVTAENASVLAPYFEDWIEDVDTGAPLTALLKDGAAVSICCSVRMTSRAHEAGVETHPEFRGRGYAARVIAAWADAVLQEGRIPLYSTSWQNQASREVAEKLRLIQYGSTLHFT